MRRVNVTKTFLPPIEEYRTYLDKIWESGQLTNQGPLLLELENKLEAFLRVKNLHFVANGTLALQVALRALGVSEGEIITTPFSYVATTSSILWEGCRPVFVDIDPDTLCIDADKIEGAITKDTKAIMAVHVFGHACDVDKIDAIARKHKLKVIYDGAHAFGVEYRGESLLGYGDITTCSFHATKVFHTVEGGCLVVKDDKLSERVEVVKRFGHEVDRHLTLGINAKASEFHAAMGLCNIRHIGRVIAMRKKISDMYDGLLGEVERPSLGPITKYNYGYYPVLLESEAQLMERAGKLNEKNVFPRRYFYPSLNTLTYLESSQHCPISENVAGRILCLPIYPGLEEEVVEEICEVVKG